jgi:Fe-S cluster assembly protein SufD
MSGAATSAAGVFGSLHAGFVRTSAGSGLDFARALRADAFARFEAAGLPSPHDEEWRHTSIAPIAGGTFRLPDDRAADGGQVAALRLPGYEAVFVNGRYSPVLSNLRGRPSGLEIASLRDALAVGAPLVRTHLSQVAATTKPFTALNAAFLEDGAVVHIAAGTVLDQPVHLVFFSTSTGTPSMSTPRVLVVAERGSQAKIVETYAGEAGEAYFTNAVTEIVLEDGAVIDHYKRQVESDRGLHVGRIEVRQDRGSVFNSFSLAFGGALSRTDIDVRLAGEGSECGLYGLFVGEGTQHLDHHTLIDHAAARCSSREVYKGILDGQSRGVFFGTIVVRPGAQKTDAHQTNKNLLLSREALVNSTPRLQIEADDVRCKHGSTTGQLDPTALFYLRSRGIGEGEARSVLTYAFAADVVERIPLLPLRKVVAGDLDRRLPGAGAIAEAAS